MGLSPLQKKVLNLLKDYMREKEVYLGGGTALVLKYDHRKSYDLDLFSWKIASETFINDVFQLLTGFNRLVLEPVIIVDDGRESVKIELHERGEDIKLLGSEFYEDVPVLSDEDILAEKVYFFERCFERDIYDVRFLVSKGYDPLDVVRRKFGSQPDPVRMKEFCPRMWEIVRDYFR